MVYTLITLISIVIGFLLGYLYMKKKTAAVRYNKLLDQYNEAARRYNDLYRKYNNKQNLR